MFETDQMLWTYLYTALGAIFPDGTDLVGHDTYTHKGCQIGVFHCAKLQPMKDIKLCMYNLHYLNQMFDLIKRRVISW